LNKELLKPKKKILNNNIKDTRIFTDKTIIEIATIIKIISTTISARTVFIKDKLTTNAIVASGNRTEPPIN